METLTVAPGFPQRLLAARKKVGLSQERLGKEIHSTKQTVWYWEKGRSEPTPSKRAQVADVLCVSREWLYYGDGEPKAVRIDRDGAPIDLPKVHALALAVKRLASKTGRPEHEYHEIARDAGLAALLQIERVVNAGHFVKQIVEANIHRKGEVTGNAPARLSSRAEKGKPRRHAS